MIGGDALYGFIARTYLQYLGNLTFCVPGTFGGGKFQGKFIKPGSGGIIESNVVVSPNGLL